MGSYYENASLTLALDCATDSEQPVLKERAQIPYLQLPSDSSPIYVRSAEDYEVADFAGVRMHATQWDRYCIHEGSPLHHRGWTFQERKLSRRILHFTGSQLYWECAHHTFLECDTRPKGRKSNLHEMLLKLQNSDRDNEQERVCRAFLPSVESYNHRALKEPKDRLIAFQGIAQAFAPLLKDDIYLLGMWSSHLPRVIFF